MYYVGLQSTKSGLGSSETAADILNEYTIEYAEDIAMRDTVLQSTRKVDLMRYVPELKRILLIAEGSDSIMVMSDDFSVLSRGEERRY